MVNPWAGPFETFTEQVDADWGGVWALVSTSCRALEVVQQRASGTEDDWVLNLSGYFIVSACVDVVSLYPPAGQSAAAWSPRRLEFGDCDGALAAICLLLDGAQQKLIQLVGRTALDLGDQLNALSVHRYLECAEVTITRMLESRRADVQ